MESIVWKHQQKHYFVLSSSGKPIFTLHGDETELLSLTGVLQTLIAFYIEDGDQLRYLKASGFTVAILVHEPLYFVVISRDSELPFVLEEQLRLLKSQILFSVTNSQLQTIFNRYSNFDLRTMIGGTKELMINMVNSFETPSVFLKSYKSMKISLKYRKLLQKCWVYASPSSATIYGLVISNRSVVQIAPTKRVVLGVRDIALLLNLVNSSPSFRTVETWTPACLPDFNDTGFLHCYSSFFNNHLGLILLSTEKDSFYEQSAFRHKLFESMQSVGLLQPLTDEIAANPFNVVELGIAGLRHVLIKINANNSYFEPSPVAPYTDQLNLNKLYNLYSSALHLQEKYETGPITYLVSENEAIGFWNLKSYQIYCAFSPLTKKDVVNDALKNIKDWVNKNADRL